MKNLKILLALTFILSLATACHYSCATCTGSEYNQCLTCNGDKLSRTGSATSVKCLCNEADTFDSCASYSTGDNIVYYLILALFLLGFVLALVPYFLRQQLTPLLVIVDTV